MQLFISSGNQIADRRFEFGKELEKRGDLAGAADLYAQAVEIAPGFASAWFALGEVKARRGETDAAVVVVAADSLPYWPDLVPLAREIARVLERRGLFAFTVETHEGPEVLLRETLRYAHGQGHVRGALAEGGLDCIGLRAAWSRREKGIPVPGLVVVAAKPASTAPMSPVTS